MPLSIPAAARWLHHHGIETREVAGKLEAWSAWTQAGKLYGEWEKVTCTLAWLRDWMGY